MEGIIAVPIILFVALIGLLAFAFWVWALIDAFNNESPHGNDKALWLLIILFAQFPGALIYYLVRKPQREKEKSMQHFGKQ